MVEFLTPQIRDGLRIFDFMTYRSNVASRLRELGRTEKTDDEVIAAEKKEEQSGSTSARALLIRDYRQRADIFVNKFCAGKAATCEVDVRAQGVNINTARLNWQEYEIVSVLARTMLQRYEDSSDLDALLEIDDRDIRNAFYIKKNLFQANFAAQGTEITIDMVFPNFFSYVDNIFPSGNYALASTVYIALDPSRPPRFHPNGVVAEISVKGLSVPRSGFGGREAVNGVDQIFFTPEGRVQEIVFNSGADYAIKVGSVVFRNPKVIVLKEDVKRPGIASIRALMISEDIKLPNGTMLKADDLVYIDGKNSKIVKYARGGETVELNLDVSEATVSDPAPAPAAPQAEPEAQAPVEGIVITGNDIGNFKFDEKSVETDPKYPAFKSVKLSEEAQIKINGAAIKIPKGSILNFWDGRLSKIKSIPGNVSSPAIQIRNDFFRFNLRDLGLLGGIKGELAESVDFEIYGIKVSAKVIEFDSHGDVKAAVLDKDVTFKNGDLTFHMKKGDEIGQWWLCFSLNGGFIKYQNKILLLSDAFAFFVNYSEGKTPSDPDFGKNIKIGWVMDPKQARINGEQVKAGDQFVVKNGKLVKVDKASDPAPAGAPAETLPAPAEEQPAPPLPDDLPPFPDDFGSPDSATDDGKKK